MNYQSIWSRQHILFKCSDGKFWLQWNSIFSTFSWQINIFPPQISFISFLYCTCSISLTNITLMYVTLNYYYISLHNIMKFQINGFGIQKNTNLNSKNSFTLNSFCVRIRSFQAWWNSKSMKYDLFKAPLASISITVQWWPKT